MTFEQFMNAAVKAGVAYHDASNYRYNEYGLHQGIDPEDITKKLKAFYEAVKVTQEQFPSAAQPWLNNIPVMQQSVLFSAIRGPDGLPKSHSCKPLLRFYRRCVLISAFDGRALDNPHDSGGGSFTGPSFDVHPEYGLLGRLNSGPEGDGWWPNLNDWPMAMQRVVDQFLNCRDEYNLHYWGHAMHAFQIVGVHHPIPKIRAFWADVYRRMVNAQHLLPEPAEELNRRLSDNKGEWALKDEGDGYRQS